jgi:MOSC domain-containing protein YiiM
VVAVSVGAVRELGDGIRTGFRKAPREGPVRVEPRGLDGDAQAEAVHGGRDRAILAYAASHYAKWNEEYADRRFAFGGFGENLTIEGLDESAVCIGDVYRVGTAVLEVSVPRTPCTMISRATGIDGLFERARDAGRCGWMHRVLEEGTVQTGDAIERIDRRHVEWPVARAAAVMARVKARQADAIEDARRLAALPALAEVWRTLLLERAADA